MARLRPDADHDAVCASTARHQVVVAPPGTGKTHVAVRLAGVLAPVLPPESRVLLLTFSNQARSQLEKEAERQLPREARLKVEVTNYHRFFWHAVRAHRRALGLPLDVGIGSRQRREQVLLRVAPRHLRKAFSTSNGLTESLAEHSFPAFRDARTPACTDLVHLLAAVTEEQRAGRLVFGDLGALFWSLLEGFPAIDLAYQTRYPVVIADEHQDASALQDAVVRRLGRRRLVVLADPMQLIHGFRGADPARLERHCNDCAEKLELKTPHRWHGNQEAASWLLAVRARLTGQSSGVCSPPAGFRLRMTDADRGFPGMKPTLMSSVAQAFRDGATSVAVLSRMNREVHDLQRYLTCRGFYPREVSGDDFEEARAEIEELPTIGDAQKVAQRVLGRLGELFPSLDRRILSQADGRLGPGSIKRKGASPIVTGLLQALEPIYLEGPRRYFSALLAAVELCRSKQYHAPRVELVRTVQTAVDDAARTHPDGRLDEVLACYEKAVVAAAHVAPRTTRGLFVMTVHQAKGKEFDAVVVVNASGRCFPDTDEGRRLFYVALTRASKLWTVIAPDTGESPLLRYLGGSVPERES
jgi:DNA helicase-2/ATP-dependent DNA helicase PcrA